MSLMSRCQAYDIDLSKLSLNMYVSRPSMPILRISGEQGFASHIASFIDVQTHCFPDTFWLLYMNVWHRDVRVLCVYLATQDNYLNRKLNTLFIICI